MKVERNRNMTSKKNHNPTTDDRFDINDLIQKAKKFRKTKHSAVNGLREWISHRIQQTKK